ncbi:MAG: hypothetical protein LBT09_13305 [Planctomycetaceae bacterium]|nr:hypothetical protein [Planctomycetaceae bacterium]
MSIVTKYIISTLLCCGDSIVCGNVPSETFFAGKYHSDFLLQKMILKCNEYIADVKLTKFNSRIIFLTWRLLKIFQMF